MPHCLGHAINISAERQAAAADTERTVECASVLDEMLCELEVWDAENAWRSHQREIREKEVHRKKSS